MPADTKPPVVRRPPRRGLEVHNLTGRMNTGIGTASAHQCDRMIGNPGNSRCQHGLHRSLSGLRLPAAEATPVVFNAQGNAQD